MILTVDVLRSDLALVELLQTFLVHSEDGRETAMSVRLPGDPGAPLVHNLPIKQHKTCTCYTQLLLSVANLKGLDM